MKNLYLEIMPSGVVKAHWCRRPGCVVVVVQEDLDRAPVTEGFQEAAERVAATFDPETGQRIDAPPEA